MGDVAMTAPIVSAVCRSHPTIHFDYLSTAFFEPFLEPLPNLTFVPTNIHRDHGNLVDVWKLYKELTAADFYDAVIDLHDVIRTKALRAFLWLAGSSVYVIDKGRKDKKNLTSGKIHCQLMPMTDRYAATFAKAGLTFNSESHSRPKEPLPPTAGLQPKAQGEVWIGVSPFAQHEGKRYPLELMKQVIERLSADGKVRIIVFGGGAAEKLGAEALVADIPNAHNMIGMMKLRDEMALMSNLDCMVSMDSSAMHICSLYGVRVVSIWGATHPYAGFLGYGQKEGDVVQIDDLKCRPCSVFGNKRCKFGDYRCMQIQPEDIVKRVLFPTI